MLRELDSRTSHPATISLMWDDATGELRLDVADRNSLVIVDNVSPLDARYAFTHPYAYIGDRDAVRRTDGTWEVID